MATDDPMQVLYHLSKTIEAQTASMGEMQKDLNQIKIDIAVMKQSGVMPINPEEIKKERLKDGATGGGIAGLFVAIIIGLFEYLKTKI